MSENQRRRNLKQEQARRAPIRALILDLYEQDRSRSKPVPANLIDELTENFGERVTEAQYDYHLRWLRESS